MKKKAISCQQIGID